MSAASSADSGWICTPFGVSELPDDGISGTHFALCLCDVYPLRQHVIKGDTKVCRIVTVCEGVTVPCDVEVFRSVSVPKMEGSNLNLHCVWTQLVLIVIHGETSQRICEGISDSGEVLGL